MTNTAVRRGVSVFKWRDERFPVRDYLAAVLPGFADLPIQRLPDLTPTAWVAHHSRKYDMYDYL